MKKLEKISRVYIEDYDINVDTFLAPEKVKLIGDEMLEHQDQTERDYVENILLAKICTDIGEKYEYGDHYNELMYNGIFDVIKSNISNIYDIDRYVEYQESLQHQMVEFLKQAAIFMDKYGETIEKQAKEMKKFEPDKMNAVITNLKEINKNGNNK